VTLVMSLLPAAANAKQNSDDISSSQVTEGFRISPIPEAQLTFKKGARGQVGMGSYIVNSSGACSGCHSYPEFLAAAPGDPFNGLPSAQTLKTIAAANYNTAHFLAGGQCFRALHGAQHHARYGHWIAGGLVGDRFHHHDSHRGGSRVHE
jgi:hypothetical protein